MDTSFIIEKIKETNFNAKIKNEIIFLKENDNLNLFNNSQHENINDRILILEKILSESENTFIKKEDNIQQKKDNLFTEIDKYTYKKQWNKLPSFHKIVKIKEFIRNTYGEGNIQSELITKLSDYTNEGKINTKKYVIYDPNLEKILSIPVLSVDLNKNSHQLKII